MYHLLCQFAESAKTTTYWKMCKKGSARSGFGIQHRLEPSCRSSFFNQMWVMKCLGRTCPDFMCDCSMLQPWHSLLWFKLHIIKGSKYCRSKDPKYHTCHYVNQNFVHLRCEKMTISGVGLLFEAQLRRRGTAHHATNQSLGKPAALAGVLVVPLAWSPWHKSQTSEFLLYSYIYGYDWLCTY